MLSSGPAGPYSHIILRQFCYCINPALQAAHVTAPDIQTAANGNLNMRTDFQAL